jgi:2-oxoisovalerate ferredoxin oxidoreductase alpha subunit
MPHQWYYEFRYKIQEAMETAASAIRKVDEEYASIFGRSYGGLVDLYCCEDAETVIVAAGSMSSTIRAAIDEMRQKGRKIGLARIRVFRPFPFDEFRELASRIHSFVVLDRSFGMGCEGAFFSEIKAALYPLSDRPDIRGYAVGIGGRDVTVDTIISIVTDSETNDNPKWTQEWIGLRGCEE